MNSRWRGIAFSYPTLVDLGTSNTGHVERNRRPRKRHGRHLTAGLVGRVHLQIAWAKLRALRDGAAIASKKLWS